MSRDRCCVPGCVESGSSSSVLHGFPNPDRNPELFRSWVYAVGGHILGLDNQYIYKLRRVCHVHFEDKYCCRFNRISNIAVPTLKLPGPLAILHDVVICRPLQDKQNTTIDAPSCSKDPVIFASYDSLSGEKVKETENIIPSIVNDPEVEVFNTSQRKHPMLAESNIPKVQNKRSKLIKHVAATKAEKKLYKTLMAVKVKLSKCRNKIRKQNIQLKSAKEIFSNPELLNIMDSWTTSAKIFTLMQFRQIKKKSKGRRFSTEEKIVALTMLKQSPKAYRFLSKIFVLPSCQTISKFLSKCLIRPGINKSIFTQLKMRGDKMKDEHKLCVLAFDEMQLKAGIAYNERTDRVSGFVTDGQENNKILADHAQVFLIRGLFKNFKQPVAYTFSAGATKGLELAKQLKSIIKEIQQAGFNVVATVCDQGTNNRQAIKILKEETRAKHIKEGTQLLKENVFCINTSEIIPIFDPPHLLKGMRNNLITKDLSYIIKDCKGTAKWSNLEMLYKEDPGFNGIKLMPTLTENHIVPAKIKKMKVKYASQVFSKKIACNMGYFAAKHILPEECKETAYLLNFMDDLFDSMNGSYKKNRHAKPLLGPVTPNSRHKQFWKEAKRALKTFQFINYKNKKEYVPTVQNWITTIEGVEDLVSKLEREYNITSVWMRHLNQDPLENFFGAIRSHGSRNTNPTCDQFESAFATLLINNLTSVHAPGSNCENDYAKSLYSLILNKDCEVNKTCEIDINDLVEIEFTPMAIKSDPKIIAPLEYIGGYFIKKSKENIWKTCGNCKNNLCSIEQKEYIKHREFAGRNWLYSPNDMFMKSLSEMQDITNYILKKYITKNLLKQYCKLVATCLVDLSYLDCPIHKEKLRDFLINGISRFFIFTYCKNINKIMYGKKDIDTNYDVMQVLAKNYFKKYMKFKK